MGDITAMAYKEVIREPVVREAYAAAGVPAGIDSRPRCEGCVAATD